jgi:hypothetical protein
MPVASIKQGSSSSSLSDLRDSRSQVEKTHRPSFIVESDPGVPTRLIGSQYGRVLADSLNVVDVGHSDQRNDVALVSLNGAAAIGSGCAGSVW